MSPSRRVRGPATALVVALVLLAAPACGRADYCEQLRQDQEIFATSAGPGELLQRLDTLRRLAKAAPGDLSDEWQTLLGALEVLDEALRAADVEPRDFRGGKPPAGLSTGERAAIAQAASGLSADDVIDAAAGIEQQAKDVCGLQFGL